MHCQIFLSNITIYNISHKFWWHLMKYQSSRLCLLCSLKHPNIAQALSVYWLWLCEYCTVSSYVWIWYLCWGTDRVDGCGINTAHYPIFGRWSPWVGLIYRSDGQSIPFIPPFPSSGILGIFPMCLIYRSDGRSITLNFPSPLGWDKVSHSRCPGTEQPTCVGVYLFLTHHSWTVLTVEF